MGGIFTFTVLIVIKKIKKERERAKGLPVQQSKEYKLEVKCVLMNFHLHSVN
jgi:hypothetical protein